MDGVEQYPFDVALSYVTDDTSIAKALINALESKGLKVFRDEIGSYFVSSRNFYIHSKDLLEKAHHDVILLSQPYLAQNYFEPPSSQINQLQQQKSRIILLRIGNADIPQTLRFFSAFELSPDDVDHVVEIIEQRRSQPTTRQPPQSPPAQPVLIADSPPPYVPLVKTKEQWLAEGKYHYSLRDWDKALKAFEEAIKLDHNYKEALDWKNRALQHP